MFFSFLVVLFLSLTVTTAQKPHPENVAISQVVSNGPALEVTWDPPATTRTVADYQVQYRIVKEGSGLVWVATERVGNRDITSYTIEGLKAGTTYAVRVLTVFGNGGVSDYDTGSGTQKTTFAVPSKVGSPPTVTEAVSSGRPALTVSWSAPQSESPITKYQVQYRKSPSDDVWMSRNVTSTSTSTTLPNLDAGTGYSVRVRAVSGAGKGPFSNIRRQTTFSVPSEVTGVMLSVVSGQAALRVNWTNPSSDQPIIRYEVEYGERGVRWIANVTVQGADSLTTTITNLQKGTTYVVRVRAVSDAGAGNYTEPERRPYLILPNLPSQVSGVMLSAVSGDTAIRVNWNNPSVEGSFLRYDVQYKTRSQSWDASNTKKVMDKNSVTVDLLALQRGTTYKVRVKTVSNAGTGNYSTEATYTLPRLPSEVTGVMLSVVSGQAALRVNWTNPSSDQPIIRYEVEYGERGVRWIANVTVQGADSLTTTITNLQKGTTYVVRVRAVSDAGAGNYTEPERRPYLILPNLPSQVTGVRLSVVSGQAAIRVTWNIPSVEGTFIRYVVQYKTSSHSWNPSNTVTRKVMDNNTVTVDLLALERSTPYTVRVKAVSNAGTGVYSADAIYTLPTLPPPVTGVSLSVVSGQATIRVTWTKPSVEGTFTRYDVQHKTSSQDWIGVTRRQVTGENTVTVDLPSLQRGTTYNVRVRAVSNAGNGDYSAEANYTIPRLPPQITGVSLSVVSGQAAIRVSWINPSVEGNFYRYDVQYKPSGSHSWDASTTRKIMDKNTVTVDLPSLERGTTYIVRVRAVFNADNGPYSAEATITLPILPSQITGVSLSVVSGQAAIRVTWSIPSVEGTFLRYDVQYKTSVQSWDASRTRKVMDKNAVTVDLPALQRGTPYKVRAKAVSNAGTGLYSVEATYTLPTLPSQITGVRLAVVSGQATIRVTWNIPSDEGTFLKYDVQYKTSVQSWDASRTRKVMDKNTVTVDLPALQRGTPYNVRVKAVSNAGTGLYSAPQATYTLPRLPPPVSGVVLSVVPGQAAIRVTWNKPSVEGTFYRYDVQYKPSGSQSWDDSTTKKIMEKNIVTVDLPSLQRGTAYNVRVKAVSNAGTGLYSAEATYTVLRLPSAVYSVNFTTTESNGSVHISLTWKAPTTDVTITHYEVMYRESGLPKPNFTSITPAATINGIANEEYLVCIKAVSAVGAGGEKCTNIAPPTPPTVSATSITTTTVTVTWKDEGFQYRLYIQRHDTELRSPPSSVSSPHTITGLDSNTLYTITVEAYSPLGSNGTYISVYTVPEAPSSLNLEVVSSTVIRVTWTAPPNADRLPLTYLISYQSEFGSGMEEVSTANHELTAHGLHPFAEYTVRVQARNTGGQLSGNVTGQSTTLSAAPSSPPRIVRIVDKLKTHNSLTWTWQLPVKAGRNGIISSYFIIFARVSSEEHQPVGNFTKVVDNPSFDAPTHLTYTFTSLSPHTFYSIRIAAVTSGGTGVFSALQKTNTTLDLYVSMLTVDVNSNSSSNISWAAPGGMGSVTSYTVYYGVYENTTAMNKTTPMLSTRLNNLTPETPIEVSVKPVTGQGSGGPVSKIFFTREGVPTVPVKDVTVMRINRVSLRVSWTPLSLHEARGWPVYTVLVESTAGRTTRATLTRNTNDSTVDVDGLIPCTSYSVRVQVGTSAGTNEFLISDPVFLGPLPTANAAAIAAVLVVIILLVIAIVITVVVIVFLYRARKKSAKLFSPSQSESEVEIKGGKGNSVQMMALSSTSEKHDILEGRISNIKNENNQYTVTTSMGASVPKSDFASHVLMMQKDRDSGFEKEYMSIINDPEGVEAIAKANKLKNRYINIHTFDHSRVVLTVPDDNGSDYINASYIDGYKKDNAYIASQGPTPSTISDFWQMIVDHKAPVIVMLTKVEEKGKKKCEQYWEETLNTKVDKGRGIQVTTVKFTPYADYEVREFQVTSSSSPSVQPLKVKHFLYTAWPDHGVPQHPSSLVRFTHKVRRAYQNSAAPIIVHCSAGVGRTGTYLTIDAMMQRIREVDDLNIYEFVVDMRSKRTFMVQNQDQYAFIHDALCDHITCGDTSIPAHELRRITIGMEANDPKTNKSGFEQQFEFLDSLSKTPCGEDVKFAKKNTISKKNRHRDRCAYSNNHLHIPGKSASNGSDYINASYVDSYSRKNAFIAAQTPLSSTVVDFWELLWQFKPPTVVVLTSADDDKDGADFWPTQEEGVADYGVVKVNHKATMPCSDYDRHSLEVVDKRKDKCTPYNLTLFHFKVWSLDSTPYLPSLLDMMGEVERCHSGSTKSITVACSDGMSRTGVFISTMSEVERVKTESEVDLFQTIKLARAKRPFMVFTVEQYKLCFDILQAYLDSFDTYANFKVV